MNIDIYLLIRFSSYLTFTLLLFFLMLLAIRGIINNKMDSYYGIKTTGLRDWDKNKVYNRTESTPYQALKDFAKVYKAHIDSHLVDFGAGKARVTIYLNDSLNIPVTGIEINDLTYNEAERNVEMYLSKKNAKSQITLLKEYAEEYIVKEEDNIFFFFNPFSTEIFIKVLRNIKESADIYNKEVEVILYYPINGYKESLESEGFELINKVKSSKAIGFNEVFLVYKYRKSEELN